MNTLRGIMATDNHRRDYGQRPGRIAYAVLEEAGGVAGARYLADEVSSRSGRALTVRAIRDLMRNYRGVRKLGAGFYALPHAELPPVVDFVHRYQSSAGDTGAHALAEAVLETYPHGSRRAVLAWLAQKP